MPSVAVVVNESDFNGNFLRFFDVYVEGYEVGKVNALVVEFFGSDDRAVGGFEYDSAKQVIATRVDFDRSEERRVGKECRL